MIGAVLVTGKTDEEFNKNLKKATNKWFKDVIVGDVFIDNEGKKCVLIKYTRKNSSRSYLNRETIVRIEK
jgi:phenylalanyl-tRNA synthetase beta subunit